MAVSVPKKETSPNLRYQRDKDREIVKGIFRFYEVPGGSMSFSLKMYKEDKVERYDLIDGHQYSIPLGVARHLNNNGWYPVYEHVKGEPGMAGGFDMSGNGMRISQKVRRFSFQSLEFIDMDEFSSQAKNSIITVENAGL